MNDPDCLPPAGTAGWPESEPSRHQPRNQPPGPEVQSSSSSQTCCKDQESGPKDGEQAHLGRKPGSWEFWSSLPPCLSLPPLSCRARSWPGKSEAPPAQETWWHPYTTEPSRNDVCLLNCSAQSEPLRVASYYGVDLGEGSLTIIVCTDYCNSRK